MRFFSEDDVVKMLDEMSNTLTPVPPRLDRMIERAKAEPIVCELGDVDPKAFLVWWLSEKTPWEEHKHELVELAFHVAGAATVPLLEDHPDYVFPAERVKEAVRTVLAERGIDRLPEGYR